MGNPILEKTNEPIRPSDKLATGVQLRRTTAGSATGTVSATNDL